MSISCHIFAFGQSPLILFDGASLSLALPTLLSYSGPLLRSPCITANFFLGLFEASATACSHFSNTAAFNSM